MENQKHKLPQTKWAQPVRPLSGTFLLPSALSGEAVSQRALFLLLVLVITLRLLCCCILSLRAKQKQIGAMITSEGSVI